jgi:hypothetical protein
LINKDVEDCFWQFIVERQNIWYKRFVLKEQWPWTADEALQTVFFTNVYRELDKGTIYLMDNIIDRGTPEQELFEILLYRQFNNRDTYQLLRDSGREFGDFEDWKRWRNVLRIDKTLGASPFTKAHMTSGVKHGGFLDKLSNICWLLNKLWTQKEEIYEKVMSAKSLEDQCRRVQSLDGFGPFLAYEVVTDLGYSPRLKKFSEDDWANPGPGCRRGIDALCKAGVLSSPVTYLDVIKALRWNQKEFFREFGIKFPNVAYLEGKELSLRNIEHSLCEFSKYLRGKSGTIRRKYSPNLNEILGLSNK